MCQRVTCTKCGKPTYVGCGRHVEEVLGDVAPGARCKCHEHTSRAAEGSKRTASPLFELWQAIRGKP